MGFLIVGVILTIIGVATNLDNPTRIWTALMYNDLYFLLIALAALFFITAHTVGYGAWLILVKRIPEAMASFIKWGSLLMVPILVFGAGSIYHWMVPGVMEHDALLAGKSWYLNIPGFFIRIAIYLGLWTFFAWMVRKISVQSDKKYDLDLYKKSKFHAALFLFFFGITSSMSSWDFMMGIQPHWYSTLWGWYTFISSFVSCAAVMMLFALYLKNQGYLTLVTDEHIHDIGKFMFAFSVAWAYLFFSQFMLIWYANIPEETMYFKHRIEHYNVLMWTCVLLNFIVPFLVLMMRDAKRNYKALVTGAVLIFFGHWLDFFQMTMPGALKEMAHGGHEVVYSYPGILEFGLLLTFIGLMAWVTFHALSKASLVPVGDPYIKESLYHHT